MNTNSHPFSERRATERKVFHYTAYLIFSDNEPIRVNTYDISEEGMCVISHQNIKPKTICNIQFELHHGVHRSHSLDIKARIVSSIFRSGEGFRIGLQFIYLSADDKSSVMEFLKK